MMQLQDFDFILPPELIAQVPAARRDQARLMVVDRAQQRVTHDTFANIGHYLHVGDVLVVNDTKVIPARLRGRKVGTGGKVEVLLLHELQTGRWEVLLKPAAKVRLGLRIEFGDGILSGRILERRAGGTAVMQFTPAEIYTALDKCGEVPLPPYIQRAGTAEEHTFDLARYQTVYACHPGAVAAPTAGLHFTPELLEQLTRLSERGGSWRIDPAQLGWILHACRGEVWDRAVAYLRGMESPTLDGYAGGFGAFENAGALWWMGDHHHVITTAQRARVPVFTVLPGKPDRGTLFDAGPDFYGVGRLGGELAADVLGGADLTKIPVRDVLDLVPAFLSINSTALKGLRERPIVATKCERCWDENGQIIPRLKRESIRAEVEQSLRRLGVEVIDLYQIHWPTEQLEEGWAEMTRLQKEGKVRWIGVSNFDAGQMRRAAKIAAISSVQPPYSLVRREIEADVLPYAHLHKIGVIVYCRCAKLATSRAKCWCGGHGPDQ